MNDKLVISNIALAKQILGSSSNTFKIVEREPELFEIMFPGILEYIRNNNEQDKRDFLEAVSLFSNLDKQTLERKFTGFVYPVRIISNKLHIG